VGYLEEAKKIGDILIVGINTDKSVRQNKGPKRPINSEKSRIAVVAALESVDYVFLFNEKDPRKWISQIKPDFHVKAGDYKLSQIIEKTAVEKNHGKIKIIPMKKGYSTTGTIKRIIKLAR
jgi:glycerol-3-phosphate cytidylyltransferase